MTLARTLLLASVATLAAAASALDLKEYLQVRKQYGITDAAGSAALETLIGSAVLEVKAVVKGVIRTNDGTTLMVLAPGGILSLHASETEPWLSVPNSRARLIVRASREKDYSPLRADIVASISEAQIGAWEQTEAAKAKPRQDPRTTTKRNDSKAVPLTRGKGPDWNVSAHAAIPYYADFILRYNKKLSPEKATEIATGIIGFSLQYGVDARLITAMVLVESGFNPSATSRVGAMGLGQLMPGTARGLGVRNAYDTMDNLYGTVRLVRGHLEKYHTVGADGQKYGDIVLMLAAYNAGSGAVRKYGGVPPYRETQNYIQKVIDWYRRLCGQS